MVAEMQEQQEYRDATKKASSWSYTNFVRGNPTGARTVETMLQYAGFFAPSRLADRDLAIESGYAMASLAAMAHDRILLGRTEELSLDHIDDGTCSGGSTLGHTPGSSVRLTPHKKRKPSTKEAFAEQMRLAISMLAHVQIVVEKIAGKHGGMGRRRQAITYLETLKAISRLLLLACRREMIIRGGNHVRGGRTQAARRRSSAHLGTGVQGTRRQRPLTTTGYRSSAIRPGAMASGNYEVYTGKRSGVRLVVPPKARAVWGGTAGSPGGRGGGRGAAVGGMSTCCDSSCLERIGACECGPSDGTQVDDKHGTSTAVGDQADTSRMLEGEEAEGVGGGALGSVISVADRVQVSARFSRSLRDHSNQAFGECTTTTVADIDDEPPGLSQGWLMAGEVVNILRPLVYSHGCTISGEQSWRPWLTSLGMDALAYACTARAGGGGTRALLVSLGSRDGTGGPGEGGRSGAELSGKVPVLPYLNEEQAAELRRRKLLWLLYLMRSPAFEVLAEPVARGAAGVFEGVPLLGGIARYAFNMLLYVQRHHFYTSAS